MKATISTSSRHHKRHISSSHIAQDRASQAVDGRLGQNLRFCTILDNLYGDVFAIDLGRRRKVSGVVIYTWQGEGQGRSWSHFVYLKMSYCDVTLDFVNLTAFQIGPSVVILEK